MGHPPPRRRPSRVCLGCCGHASPANWTENWFLHAHSRDRGHAAASTTPPPTRRKWVGGPQWVGYRNVDGLPSHVVGHPSTPPLGLRAASGSDASGRGGGFHARNHPRGRSRPVTMVVGSLSLVQTRRNREGFAHLQASLSGCAATSVCTHSCTDTRAHTRADVCSRWGVAFLRVVWAFLSRGRSWRNSWHPAAGALALCPMAPSAPVCRPGPWGPARHAPRRGGPPVGPR